MARKPSKKHLNEMMPTIIRAQRKMETFTSLNKRIDAKATGTMIESEKLALMAARVNASKMKAKLVTQQAYAMKDTFENSDGFHTGSKMNTVRGKQCTRVAPQDIQRMQGGK